MFLVTLVKEINLNFCNHHLSLQSAKLDLQEDKPDFPKDVSLRMNEQLYIGMYTPSLSKQFKSHMWKEIHSCSSVAYDLSCGTIFL